MKLDGFRIATKEDVAGISRIYEKIHDGEAAGRFTTGWERGVYPVEETALLALDRNDLFVYEEGGKILASGILNKIQVDVYEQGNWKYQAPDDEIMVLHTLVVDPDAGRSGIGTKFVKFYEQYALENGCNTLRLDTNERNAPARSLYGKNGYEEIGAVPCIFNGIEGINLVLLEKKL